MEQDGTFEQLLKRHQIVIERYINFRMPSTFDADDVIQETYLAAYKNFPALQNHEAFKPWMLSIARNKCNLWYRKKYGNEFLSLESIADVADIHEETVDDSVSDILNKLSRESAELLQLTMGGHKQSEISDRLGIPLGTVKSRLHYAKKQFRSACTPEQILLFEKGRKIMSKKDYTCGFSSKMPSLIIKESNRPFFEVKCEDEDFIIPRIGNKNSEGTYRYPDKNLALVSTCYVPKAAVIHDAEGVKVCRDTYNVKADKLYKNESVWFSQLTDEYVRCLGTIDCDADDDYPTYISTFLDEDYDIFTNGNDRVHGRPLLIKENPPKIENGEIFVDEYNTRYTMGTFDVTIGERQFETIKFIRVFNNLLTTENFVDKNGRLVLMRWYESVDSLTGNDNYTDDFIKKTEDNPTITVNGTEYRLVEDRISQYAI